MELFNLRLPCVSWGGTKLFIVPQAPAGRWLEMIVLETTKKFLQTTIKFNAKKSKTGEGFTRYVGL